MPPSPDLNDAFAATPEVGPVAGLASGSRGERPAFEAWAEYAALPPPTRLVVQEVWNGTRRQALVPYAGRLHLLRHVASGVPDPSGKRFGFVVRSVPLTPPAPPPKRVSGWRWVWLTLLVVLLVAAAFAAGWFAPGILPVLSRTPVEVRPEPPAAPKPTPPTPRPAPVPEPSAADRERRRVAEERFNDITAELEAVNARDAEYVRRRKADTPTASTTSFNREKP